MERRHVRSRHRIRQVPGMDRVYRQDDGTSHQDLASKGPGAGPNLGQARNLDEIQSRRESRRQDHRQRTDILHEPRQRRWGRWWRGWRPVRALPARGPQLEGNWLQLHDEYPADWRLEEQRAAGIQVRLGKHDGRNGRSGGNGPGRVPAGQRPKARHDDHTQFGRSHNQSDA